MKHLKLHRQATKSCSKNRSKKSCSKNHSKSLQALLATYTCLVAAVIHRQGWHTQQRPANCGHTAPHFPTAHSQAASMHVPDTLKMLKQVAITTLHAEEHADSQAGTPVHPQGSTLCRPRQPGCIFCTTTSKQTSSSRFQGRHPPGCYIRTHATHVSSQLLCVQRARAVTLETLLSGRGLVVGPRSSYTFPLRHLCAVLQRLPVQANHARPQVPSEPRLLGFYQTESAVNQVTPSNSRVVQAAVGARSNPKNKPQTTPSSSLGKGAQCTEPKQVWQLNPNPRRHTHVWHCYCFCSCVCQRGTNIHNSACTHQPPQRRGLSDTVRHTLVRGTHNTTAAVEVNRSHACCTKCKHAVLRNAPHRNMLFTRPCCQSGGQAMSQNA
jgi:hypothetical protein